MNRIDYLDNQLRFPSPHRALKEPNGLLAVGGDLSPERLLLAYRMGIFPWFSDDEPILWWSPDPRAVLPIDQIHISRSMQKFLRKAPYVVTLNTAFADVIHACSLHRQEGTWITHEVEKAYLSLHRLGVAHSVEVWQENTLIGGLYGVSQGNIFCGESMFSRQENASKFGLMTFAAHFKRYGGQLFDCQILNSHTASLGAIEIPRQHYLQQLIQLQLIQIPALCWDQQILPSKYNES